MSNFLEYALGGDPRDPASAPDPVIGLVTQPTRALTLTYLRARGELTYAVETTDSLAPGSWTTIGVDQDNSTAAGSPATARFPHEATLEARRFLRLRITE